MANSSHRHGSGFLSALRGDGEATPSSFLRWLLIGNLLAVSILLALIGLILSQEKEEYRERTAVATRNLAQILEQNIAALIAKTDASLQTIAYEAARQTVRGGLDDKALSEALARQHALLPEVAVLGIADASGNIRYGLKGLPAHHSSIADRGFFIKARHHPDPDLIIDGPAEFHGIGKWVVFLSRRLNRPDGSFKGVIYAAIDIEHFQRLFSRMDLGAGSVVTLRTEDMRLVARHPVSPAGNAAIGTATVSAESKKTLPTHPALGSYISRNSIDRIERTTSYFRIGDYPLYIFVALATESHLAPWRAEVLRISALAALVVLVLALSSWMAYRLWRRQWLAAASLRENAERFRLMVESVQDYAMFMLDAQGRVATWNEGAERLTAYPAKEIIGQPLRALYPAASAADEDSAAALRQAQAGGSVASESWRQRKDGTRFMANTVITAVRDDTGQLRGFTVIVRDVTEHRQAEQAAKKANALLLEAVESIAIGFSIFDPDDRLVICNQAYRNIYHTSRDLIVPGVKFEDLLRIGVERGQYPQAVGNVDAWIRERMHQHRSADGTPLEQELDDGRHLLIVEYRTPSGHIVSNRLEITELYRHQHHLEQLVEARTAELKSSMAQFRILIEQAPTAMAMFDRNFRYLAASSRWVKELGNGQDDLIGRNYYEVHLNVPKRWKGVHRAALSGATLRNDEDLWIHADGTKQWLRWAVYPWIDEKGGIGGIIISSEDISGRKQAEMALAEEREARRQILEQQVADRTDELVAANKELQGFTYAASHDLKAPLGRINSFSGLLEMKYRDRLEGDGLLFLDFIRKNATRMTVLIEDLLAHAQIEQKILDLKPMDLQKAIHAALKERDEEVRQGGVKVRLDVPTITVRANPHGFAQVLRNLLENALKYSSQAQLPVIEIGARATEGVCRLWVRDNGIGFDMVYHDRIFEIFRRLHTYEEFQGSGVGLALVRKAMERMGGRVWAESEPGRGATFHLELAAVEPLTPEP